MSKRNTSIKINGKHYDAVTGTPLHKAVDGIVASKPAAVVAKSTTIKNDISRPVRNPAKHAPKQPAKSATLMRHAVAKPAGASLKKQTKLQTAVQVASPGQVISPTVVAKKQSFHQIDGQRAARANDTSLSPRIAKFAHEVNQLAPKLSEEVIKLIDAPLTAPLPITPNVIRVYTPSNATPAQTNDIFEQALARATSHEQPAPTNIPESKQTRRARRVVRQRMLAYTSGALAVIVLAGALSLYNANGIKFRMASNKAGFSATMPNYSPKGFSVASLRATSGLLNVNYATSDVATAPQTFTVTEKPSNWNSQTLLSNVLAGDDTTAYSTIQAAGRTVYVYGKNQAAWVNNGILYQILGNGALSTQEFVKIASSM